ncbi:MAG: hypothetical protein HYZ67_00730 [Chlamydiae bacterium]|nr:hypothetical protein [Chlamydiota bacterium]
MNVTLQVGAKKARRPHPWFFDVEIHRVPFPYVLVRLRGKFTSSKELKIIFYETLDKATQEGERMVFDFEMVDYASSLFLRDLRNWCKAQNEGAGLICSTRVPFFLKDVMKSLEFYREVKELPYERNRWTPDMFTKPTALYMVMDVLKRFLMIKDGDSKPYLP